MTDVLQQNCNSEFSDTVCVFANVCGYCSSIVWLVVLLPQLIKNFRRRTCCGLSLAWASANFTASLCNVFFVFSLDDIPYFTKFSAVYMPVLEAGMLVQFVIYHEKPWATSDKLLWLAAALFWCAVVSVEVLYAIAVVPPAVLEWLSWSAIALWSVELFPQLRLNLLLHSTQGQSTLAVALTFLGKTTDVLSAFLLSLPLQFAVLAFFSTSTAYLNVAQVVLYSAESQSRTRLMVSFVFVAVLLAAICLFSAALVWRSQSFLSLLCPCAVVVVVAVVACEARHRRRRELLGYVRAANEVSDEHVDG